MKPPAGLDQQAGPDERAAPGTTAMSGKETKRLRLLFLVPLGIAILAIISALTLALLLHKRQSVDEGVLRIRASARGFYDDSIRYDARALRAVMDALQRDHELKAALKQKDRQRLLRLSAPMFEEMKAHFSITHFYFTTPDRVNLLRVHTPQRYGDVIDRFTTRSAEQSGTVSYGVEMGPLGTFTLRLVSPWYDDETRELLGYVELGMEIDRVLQKLRDFFELDVFVLIHKDVLDRKKWEDGMRALGRTPNWDRFPTVVVGSQTPDVVPPVLAERITGDRLLGANVIVEATSAGSSYRMTFLLLQDAAGNDVAHLVLLANVSREVDAALTTVYIGSAVALVAGAALFFLFFWQVGRIGRRIEQDAHELERLATQDALTGLYNRRTFDMLLAEEIARSRRHNYAISLLMIDVDHFKRVNDTHGHPAGDAILRGLGGRLRSGLRSIDRLCRYGGEELVAILPQSEPTAALVAERLRATVAAQPFDIGDGEQIGITVSIGAASIPDDADNAAALIAAADAALYAAKQEGRNRVCTAETGAAAG